MNIDVKGLFGEEFVKDKGIKKEVPTGFDLLDRFLDGGLYEGVYLLGAVSGLGKTAFSLQVADQIAARGNDVIFYSLEMSTKELMRRSISRNSAIIGKQEKYDPKYFLNSGDLRNLNRFENLSDRSRRLFKKACQKYFDETGKNLIISEALAMNVEKIKQDVIDHVKYTDNKPIVFIDCLQLLVLSESVEQPETLTSDDRVAKFVLFNLKQLAKEYEIIFFVTCNFKAEPLSIETLDESKAFLGYSDVVLGLEQNRGKDFGEDKNKDEDFETKNIDLKILKNKHGISNVKIPFEFDAPFTYFKEKAVK